MRLTAILIFLVSIFSLSCSKVDNTIEGVTIPALSVTTSSATLAVGNSITLEFKGGKSPYTFEIRSGTGTVDSNGKFTATAIGTSVVAIKDSRGQEQLVTITVNKVMSSSLSQATSYPGYTTSISQYIEGGVPPYDYTILTGTGQITSDGLYTGTSTATDVIKVSDSLQNSVSMQIKNYTKPLIDIDFTQTFVVNPLFTMIGGSTRGAFFNSSGVLETPSTANQIRVGHDPITKKPLGMLIESSNTHHILRSELFNHTAWVKTGVTVLADQLTAPDGLNSVDMLYETAGVSEHSVKQDNLGVNASIYYTWSIYVKKLNQRWIALSVFDPNPVASAWFDLDNGVWGTTSGVYRAHPAENVGNGIYRISITAKPNATPASFQVNIANSDGGSFSYNGDVTKGVYVWGAQVNGDSANWMGVVTSYKQTAGATVTSTDDRVDLPDFQKWFNYDEGSLLTNIISTQKSRLANIIFNLGDAAFTNGHGFTVSRDGTASTQSSFLILNASVDQVNFHSGASWSTHEYHRLLSSYKTTAGASLYDNGVQIGTSTSTFTMPPFSKGRLGQYTAQNNYVPLAGYFNRFSYWPTRLSDSNLQELSNGLTMIPSISLARTQFNKALNAGTLDLSAYVTGGTPPYTYSLSGAGSLSSAGVFTPSTAGTATVAVTDSNNNGAKFDITVIAPTVEFDFTQGSLNSLDGNYAVTFTRASTATYFDINGVMQTAAVNVPRFDYDPKTHAPLGLLLEMNKTNLITQSQVDQWTPEQITLTANQGVAPDGSGTADKIVATSGFPRARISFTPTAGTKYVLSVYAKMLVGTNLSLRYEQGGDVYRVAFNGTTGAMVSTAGAGTTPSYGSKDIGGGWFRLWISVAAPTTAGNFWIIPGLYNGATPTEEILFWGAQVEEGVTPSSYIPTAGATVARSWDSATETTVGWVTQGKGTFHITASQPYDVVGNTDQYTLSTLRIDGNNGVSVYKSDNTTPSANTNRTRLRIRTGGGVDHMHISVGSSWAPNTVISAAMAYGKNYVRGSATGGTTDDFDSAAPGNIAILNIGSGGNAGGGTGSRVFDGHIRTFRYWPYRMTNEDLAVLAPP